jgi:hypothetical protein
MSKRYEIIVAVKRQFILYADDVEVAKARVEREMRNQGQLLSFEVESVRELPAIENEAKNPEVDHGPPRETRQ